jgi:hypothetical protein
MAAARHKHAQQRVAHQDAVLQMIYHPFQVSNRSLCRPYEMNFSELVGGLYFSKMFAVLGDTSCPTCPSNFHSLIVLCICWQWVAAGVLRLTWQNSWLQLIELSQ